MAQPVIKYKFDLTPYMKVVPEAPVRPAAPPGKDAPKPSEEYDFRKVIRTVVLSGNQGHNGFRLITADNLVKKIENCKEPFILLDNTEYTLLKSAFDKIQGLSQNEVTLVRRIYEAEEVKQ